MYAYILTTHLSAKYYVKCHKLSTHCSAHVLGEQSSPGMGIDPICTELCPTPGTWPARSPTHTLPQGTGIIAHFGKPQKLVSNKWPNKRREAHADMLGGRFPERGARVRRLAGLMGKAEITSKSE